MVDASVDVGLRQKVIRRMPRRAKKLSTAASPKSARYPGQVSAQVTGADEALPGGLDDLGHGVDPGHGLQPAR